MDGYDQFWSEADKAGGVVMDRPYYEYTKGELRDEIARLQAEVDRLKAAPAVKVKPPEAGETRTISVRATWKPCVHGGGWWVADDADGVPRILAALEGGGA